MLSPTNQATEDEQERLKRETARLRNALMLSDEDAVVGNDENNAFGEPAQMETEADFSTEALTVENLRRCLDLNLDYQATVLSYLELVKKAKARVEAQIVENEEQIKIEKETKKRTLYADLFVPIVRRTTPPTLNCFKRPYFKQVYGFLPQPNQDIRLKMQRGECLAVEEFYESGWLWLDNIKQKEILVREVRRECLANLLEPHIQYRDELRQLVGELEGEAAEEATKDLETAEQTIKTMVRENDNDNLYTDTSLVNRVDWLKVAKRVGGIVNHITCRLVWFNFYSPLVNKNAFRSEEDEKLKELAAETEGRDWVEIARKLETSRAPFQCLQRYESKLAPREGDERAPPYQNLRWMPEDEKRLKDVVAFFKLSPSEQLFATRYIDWHYVAQNVGSFSAQDCAEKYVQLSSKLNSGTWSEEETKRLEEAMETFGKDWIAVSTCVATRSPTQCYHHWHEVLFTHKEKSILKSEPPPDWTPEEDAVLWFNHNSKSAFLRNYREIARLLPRRFLSEIRRRYRMLKKWHRHAEWLLKTEGTLMSLLIKSDSALTLAEVDKLRQELRRLQVQRRKQAKTAKEAELAGSISFAEESQMERLTKAMVIEASLSQDLVRDKVQLIKDIVNYKAAPIPLMEKMSSNNPAFFQNRLMVMEKMKEMLMKMAVKRDQKQLETDLASLADMDVDQYQESESFAPDQSKSGVNFSLVMSRINSALQNPALAPHARQTLLSLSQINTKTTVGKLLKITRQLENLSRNVRPRGQDKIARMPNLVEWADYRGMIGHFFRNKTIYREMWRIHPFVPYSWLTTSQRLRKGLKIVIDYSAMNETAKLLVSALGTNVEGVTAEAFRQRDAEVAASNAEEGSADGENASKIATGFGISLKDPVIPEATFRRHYADIAIQALTSKVDDEATARALWPSIRHEFDDTVHVTPEDFGDNDLSPVFPPCQATSNAYRILSMSRLRLQEIVNSECTTSAEREQLGMALQKLKDRPTEKYGLLQRRFEALFTWPALLSKVMPAPFDSKCAFGKDPAPPTVSDLLAIDEVPDSDEELAKKWPGEDRPLEPMGRRVQSSKELRTRAREPFVHKPTRKWWSAFMKGKGVNVGYPKKYRPRACDHPNFPLPTRPQKKPPQSQRISKMLEEGRYPETLEESTKKCPKLRAEYRQAKMRLMGAMESPTRKEKANIQLKQLFPIIPMVPLEDLPFPKSRIPNVPKISLPAKTPKKPSNLEFALAVADMAIRKHQEQVPITPLKMEPPPSAQKPSQKKPSSPRRKSEKPSRTGLKRGRTRSGPSPDPNGEPQQSLAKRQKVSDEPARSESLVFSPHAVDDVVMADLATPSNPFGDEAETLSSPVVKSSKKSSKVRIESDSEEEPVSAKPPPPKEKYYYRLKNKSPSQLDQPSSTPSSVAQSSLSSRSPHQKKKTPAVKSPVRITPARKSKQVVQPVVEPDQTSQADQQQQEVIPAKKTPGRKSKASADEFVSPVVANQVDQEQQKVAKKATVMKSKHSVTESEPVVESDVVTPVVRRINQADQRQQEAVPVKKTTAKKAKPSVVEPVVLQASQREPHQQQQDQSLKKKRGRKPKQLTLESHAVGESAESYTTPIVQRVSQSSQSAKKTASRKSVAESGPVATPVVQRATQGGQPQQGAQTPSAQFPTSIISSATPGQAVALIQLNHEDIMRLFQSGASSVAIAIPIPQSQQTPAFNNNTPAAQNK